jgi:hypothetical protein
VSAPDSIHYMVLPGLRRDDLLARAPAGPRPRQWLPTGSGTTSPAACARRLASSDQEQLRHLTGSVKSRDPRFTGFLELVRPVAVREDHRGVRLMRPGETIARYRAVSVLCDR